MIIFGSDICNQGSAEWWAVRRAIGTGSDADRILTPANAEPSEQAQWYRLDLIRDLIAQDAHWLTEYMNKPPNHAIENGIKREAISRAYLGALLDTTIHQVGFCLADGGMFGCSPDGLIVGDSGCLDAAVELKNPTEKTQKKYLERGTLPREYRCQVHAHLIVTGAPRCWFLSYCPPLEPLLVEVVPDDFTDRLKAEIDDFTSKYLDLLGRLRLRGRFEEMRRNTLQHFSQED